jgi:hypothetical protein
LSAPEREVTSPSDFKVLGALRRIKKVAQSKLLISETDEIIYCI